MLTPMATVLLLQLLIISLKSLFVLFFLCISAWTWVAFCRFFFLFHFQREVWRNQRI